jgi:hypothetical protein
MTNATIGGSTAPVTIAANSQATLIVTGSISNGNNYEVKIVTAKNNPFAIGSVASY